jgi:serine/threonine protein kinase
VAESIPIRGGTPDLTAELLPELEIVRPLGSGATADVFLAREPGLERLVALKVLRGEAAADEVARRRFEREARSAARITHPNVTAIHRIGRLASGVPYIVMEYVDGRTLGDLLESGGALESTEAPPLLASLAGGLAAAHEKGIVHRDVRPANVFVENRTGRAVLGDFGIAALLEGGARSDATRLTAAGVRLGDTRYLSPEQLRGEPVTEQSDVYSFGVVAYEVLTGRGPYEARTEAQQMVAHLEQAPTPLRELRPQIDAGLAALVEHSLSKDPNRRPRARELSARLAAPRGAGAPSDQPPAGLVGQFLSELRRRRVYQVLVAYGAFTAAVLGATQVIHDAFDLPLGLYQGLVLLTLGGLPAALVLAWLYDITAGGIQRTASSADGERMRALQWGGLAASVLCAALLAWLLLR